MTTITFDIAEFRERFPEFEDDTKYPDAVLQKYWDMATCYISDEDYGCLSGTCRNLAIELMTAHLTNIGEGTAIGEAPVFVNSSTVDKVSVSVTPPPQKDQYEWWLNLTSYGQQLLALLKTKAVGGCYIGGSPERAAFRQVGGYFYG